MAAAWETRQLAEAAALRQWYHATGAADLVAFASLETDLDEWNATLDVYWQQDVDAVLAVAQHEVHVWAQGSGTRFAHLLDVEFAGWVVGTADNIAAAVVDDEAFFNAAVGQDIQQAENEDDLLTDEADALPATVQAEADLVVAEAQSEAQQAVAALAAEDAQWQADEHQAVLAAKAHDLDEAAAAVTNANADQDLAAAWSHQEAVNARVDQRAVAQANDRSAHDEADTTRAGNDNLAAARADRNHANAVAAQARDQDVAVVHHGYVYTSADRLATAVHLGAHEAQQSTIVGKIQRCQDPFP